MLFYGFGNYEGEAMKNSTKADLIITTARAARCTQLEAYETIHQLLQVIGERLAKGETIQIRGFATLWPKEYKPRPARNPRNGDPHQVPARVVPRLRLVPELRKAIAAGPVLAMAEVATGEIVAAMARRQARRPQESPGTRTAAHPAPWDEKARHRALLRAVDRGLEVKA